MLLTDWISAGVAPTFDIFGQKRTRPLNGVQPALIMTQLVSNNPPASKPTLDIFGQQNNKPIGAATFFPPVSSQSKTTHFYNPPQQQVITV